MCQYNTYGRNVRTRYGLQYMHSALIVLDSILSRKVPDNVI